MKKRQIPREVGERVKMDAATTKWFRNNLGAQTTVMKCEQCGLYYKPSLGHKCKVKGELNEKGL